MYGLQAKLETNINFKSVAARVFQKNLSNMLTLTKHKLKSKLTSHYSKNINIKAR